MQAAIMLMMARQQPPQAQIEARRFGCPATASNVFYVLACQLRHLHQQLRRLLVVLLLVHRDDSIIVMRVGRAKVMEKVNQPAQ